MKSCSSSVELPTRFPHHQPAWAVGSNISISIIPISLSLSIHKLIPLPSIPQPNVVPIKQPCVGCSSRAGVWIFGKHSQCFIPLGLCWGHKSFQSVLTSLSTPAVGEVLPSPLQEMFSTTGAASFDEGFLSVLCFCGLKSEVIWHLKQKMHHSQLKIRFYH